MSISGFRNAGEHQQTDFRNCGLALTRSWDSAREIAQMLHSVDSKRLLTEEIDYSTLCRWFGLELGQKWGRHHLLKITICQLLMAGKMLMRRRRLRGCELEGGVPGKDRYPLKLPLCNASLWLAP